MNYFTGSYAQNELDIPPKSKYILLSNGIYVYTTQKKVTGFFIEELLHNLVQLKFNISRDPVCVLLKDETYYYIVFVNDTRLRETIKYRIDELDEESIELILESFKQEFLYFLTVNIDKDGYITYNMNNNEIEKTNIDNLNLQYISSTFDLINKKFLNNFIIFFKKWIKTVLIFTILSSFTYISYYYIDNKLNNYFKVNITKLKLENKKIKENNKKKENEINIKLRKLKEFNSKKDILEHNTQKLYNILNNSI